MNKEYYVYQVTVEEEGYVVSRTTLYKYKQFCDEEN